MSDLNESPSQLEVFFDGKCPLCRREIEMIRGWDHANRLLFTDISAENFQGAKETGHTTEQLMAEIHARIQIPMESNNESETKWFTGVDVFREMYQRVGFSRSVWFSKLPGVAQLLRLAYRIFASIRFKYAMNRISQTDDCGENCGWESELTNNSNANGVTP